MAEIWNLSALCRCCHKDGQFTDLKTVLESFDTSYMTLLRETLNITMEIPVFEASCSICECCIEDLIKAYNFKAQVLQCEQSFRQYCQNELATLSVLKVEVDSENEHISDDNHSFDELESDDKTSSTKDTEASILTVQVPKKDTESKKRTVKKKIPTKDTEASILTVQVPKKVTESKKGTVKKKIQTSSIIPLPRAQPINSLHPDIQKYVIDVGDKRKCTLCNRFYKRCNYKAHLRTEHKIIVTYKCDICNTVSDDNLSYKDHRRLYHNEDFDLKIKCKNCSKIFKTVQTYKKHQRTHVKKESERDGIKAYKCKICRKSLKNAKSYKRHLLIHEEDYKKEKEIFPCKYCNKTFVNYNQLTWHNVLHVGKSCTCDLCKRVLSNKSKLRLHIYRHIGVKKAYKAQEKTCNKCKIQFVTLKEYRKHTCKALKKTNAAIHNVRSKKIAKVATTDKPSNDELGDVKIKKEDLSRESCGKCIDNCVCEEENYKNIVFIKSDVEDKPKVKIEKPIKQQTHKNGREVFHCKKCSYKTIKYDYLVNHFIAKHTDSRYYCDFCAKGFVYKRTVQNHLLLYHYGVSLKKFVCEFCGGSFNCITMYNTHIRNVHENIRQFICELCPKTCKNKRDLKLHILRHTDERNFKCELCDRSFFDYSSLSQHKRLHAERKNLIKSDKGHVTCKICKTEFTNRGHFVKHYKIHKDILPYKCNYCERPFAAKYSLNRHMNQHLGVTFDCSQCGKAFTAKTILKRHIKNVHVDQKTYSKLKKCLVCKRNYGDYEKHMKFHENPTFKCSICNKGYSTQGVVNRHMAMAHSTSKLYKCKPCKRKFLLKRGYIKHNLKYHKIETTLSDSDSDISNKAVNAKSQCTDFEIEINECKTDIVGAEVNCNINLVKKS